MGLVLIFEPGDWASRSVENETVRCSGTKTLSSTDVIDPVARKPAQDHVSSCFTSDTGTRKSRISGWSSPSRKIRPPIMIHCECRNPLHQDQRPSSRYPPGATVTLPVGAADVAMHAALFSLQTSCCASSGKCAKMAA